MLLARCRRRGRGAAARATHGLEEVAGGIDHHHIALVGETTLVGFQAAIKLGKLRIFAEGVCINASSLCIPLTLDFLGVTIGVGDSNFTLAIRISLDLLRLGRPRRTKFIGDALALGGDGFTIFKTGRDSVTGPTDIEALESWFRSAPLRDVPVEERVTGG